MSATKYTVDSVGPRLNEFLRPLLKRAGFELDFELAEGHSVHPEYESPEVVLQFKGADVDLLLANKAELLLALEQVTMEALRMPSEDHSRISFDANDYRMLRIEELRLSASAARELASARRLAALPVGESSKYATPRCSSSATSTRTLVVFPTPGPPLMIETWELSAVAIARR